VLCGFDNFLKTPAHSTFSYFRKRIGKDIYYKILRRCKYNKKQKHSKDEANVKLATKNFVALGFKAKMVINTSTQLPVEVILTPKE